MHVMSVASAFMGVTSAHYGRGLCTLWAWPSLPAMITAIASGTSIGRIGETIKFGLDLMSECAESPLVGIRWKCDVIGCGLYE